VKKKTIEVYVRHYTENILDKHGNDQIISQDRYYKKMDSNPDTVNLYVKATLTFEVPEKVITLTESQFLECVEASKRAYRGNDNPPKSPYDLVNTNELIGRVMEHAKLEGQPNAMPYAGPTVKEVCPECQGCPTYIAQYEWELAPEGCRSCRGIK